MKTILIVGGVAFGVYVLMQKMNMQATGAIFNAQTVDGDNVQLFYKDGFIQDTKGRTWA